MNAERPDPYIKFYATQLVLAPVWWAVGLNLFIYHITAFLLFFSLTFNDTRANRGLFFMPSFSLVFWLSAIYAFSLIMHRNSADTSRLIASAYNLSFWGMGWMLILVFSNRFSTASIRPFLGIFPWLAGFIGTLSLIVIVAAKTGMKSIVIQTPLYDPLTRILGHTPLIENSLLLKPLHQNWLSSGAFPRFSALSPYSTASGYLILIVLILLITWGMFEKKTRSKVFIYLVTTTFVALVFTLSRTSVVAFVGSLFAVYILQKEKSFLWIFFSAVALVIVGSFLSQGLDWILKLRADSTSGRLELYQYTLSLFRGVDWFLGFGLKPRDNPYFAVPTGSHSTYMSVLFKTGLTGLTCLVLFQGQLLLRWYQFRVYACQREDLFILWKGLGGVFIGMGLCMFTGDIDAPQLVAFLYFSCVGVFEGCVREVVVSKPGQEGQAVRKREGPWSR